MLKKVVPLALALLLVGGILHLVFSCGDEAERRIGVWKDGSKQVGDKTREPLPASLSKKADKA
jgi:hypothetical protein